MECDCCMNGEILSLLFLAFPPPIPISVLQGLTCIEIVLSRKVRLLGAISIESKAGIP